MRNATHLALALPRNMQRGLFARVRAYSSSASRSAATAAKPRAG